MEHGSLEGALPNFPALRRFTAAETTVRVEDEGEGKGSATQDAAQRRFCLHGRSRNAKAALALSVDVDRWQRLTEFATRVRQGCLRRSEPRRASARVNGFRRGSSSKLGEASKANFGGETGWRCGGGVEDFGATPRFRFLHARCLGDTLSRFVNALTVVLNGWPNSTRVL